MLEATGIGLHLSLTLFYETKKPLGVCFFKNPRAFIDSAASAIPLHVGMR